MASVSNMCLLSVFRKSCRLTSILCDTRTSAYKTQFLTTRFLSYKSKFKEAKIMRKIISRGSGNSKRKKWTPQPVKFHQDTSSSIKKTKRSPRVERISVVIANHIIEAMYSGELSPEINEGNVEISEIRVLPDLSGVNVYWMATGTEKDDNIQSLLNHNSKKLRYLLTSRRVLGHIPEINFVKDKKKLQVQEVERLLKIADFGPDYQPSTLHDRWKSSDTMEDVKSAKLEEYIIPYQSVSSCNKTLNLDKSGFLEEESNEQMSENCEKEKKEGVNTLDHTSYPDLLKSGFRSDLYGLNRDALMTKILKSKEQLSSRGKRNKDVKGVSKTKDEITLTKNTRTKIRDPKGHELMYRYDEHHQDEDSDCDDLYFGEELEYAGHNDDNYYTHNEDYTPDNYFSESGLRDDHFKFNSESDKKN